MPRARKPDEELGELARLLRRLRDETGLNQHEVAKRVGKSQRWVSRIEADQQIPDQDAARQLADIYQAGDDDQARLLQLVELNLPGSVDSRLIMQRGANRAFQERIRRMEKDSALVRAYHPMLIPGALQTLEYATAIFAASNSRPGTPDNADLPVDLANERQKRWKMLHDEPDRQWVQLIAESTLDHCVADDSVMAAQMRHLLEASKLPNLRLGVIPARTRMSVIVHHGWDMYDMRGVCVGTMNATALMENADDIAYYDWLFQRIESVARFDDDARSRIRDALEAYSLTT